MRITIVNVSVGEWYPRGLARMISTVKEFGYEGKFKVWSQGYPLGSPTHQESNYSFKTYAMMWASQDSDVVLWLDSSVYAVGSIQPILDELTHCGYWLLSNPGWNLGQWCSNRALSILGHSREEMMSMPICSSGVVGLDLRTDIGRSVLAAWHKYSLIPGCFHGPHTNKGRLCSSDFRVLGHRHDQTALSVIIHDMRLKMSPLDERVSINPSTTCDSPVVKSGAVRLIVKGMGG